MSGIVLAGFNTDSPNWGCRATSLALDGLLGARHEISTRLSKAAVDAPYPLIARNASLGERTSLAYRVTGRLVRTPVLRDLPHGWFLDVVGEDPTASASRILRRARYQPRLAGLVAAIAAADHVVVNGEGSLIATSPVRRDCAFFATLCVLGKRLGTPVHVVNAMVSRSPDDSAIGPGRAPEWWSAIAATAATIAVRDPASQRLASELGGTSREIALVPDALFSIGGSGSGDPAPTLVDPPPFGGGELDVALSSLGVSDPFIALSGASIPPTGSRSGWAGYFGELAERLGERFPAHRLVLVEPCTGDDFLHQVAERRGLPLVPWKTDVWAGGRLLGSAAAYVSGRYHPSILASVGGTPLVSFGSNSHKMDGLHELLQTGGEELGPVAQVPIDDVVEAVARAIADGVSERRAATAARARALGDEARSYYERLL